LLIGTYFFFKQKYNRFVLFFVVSLYTYHSARIFAPCLALSFFIANYKLLISNYKKLFYPILLGIIITIPVLFSFLNSGGATRFGGVGLTADQGPLWRANELLNQHHNTKLFNRLIHNRRLLYLISWAQKYASHLDPNFLFLSGDEVPRSKSPDVGQLHFVELPLILIGVYFVIHKPHLSRLKSSIIPWLFISPLASSLTFQAPSALRALSMSVPLAVLSAVGFMSLSKILKIALLLLYFISLVYYLDAYYIHYPKRFSDAWSAPFSQLIPFLNQYSNLPIYITNRYDQPYILTLFYLQYPPDKIQSEIHLTSPDKYGFSTVDHFGNYYFQKINWENIPNNSLVVASDENIPTSPVKTIDFPSGVEAFKIYLK
jgi:hypothetical protein